MCCHTSQCPTCDVEILGGAKGRADHMASMTGGSSSASSWNHHQSETALTLLPFHGRKRSTRSRPLELHYSWLCSLPSPDPKIWGWANGLGKLGMVPLSTSILPGLHFTLLAHIWFIAHLKIWLRSYEEEDGSHFGVLFEQGGSSKGGWRRHGHEG